MPKKYEPHPEVYGDRPPCFTPEEWEEWRLAEQEDAEDPDYIYEPSGFCASCTLGYQTVMRARGSCRHPEVKFVLSPDGDRVGVRPAKDLPTVETHTCCTCGETKSINLFYRYANGKPRGTCRDCISKQYQARISGQ
jgi:hypothetical protein